MFWPTTKTWADLSDTHPVTGLEMGWLEWNERWGKYVSWKVEISDDYPSDPYTNATGLST